MASAICSQCQKHFSVRPSRLRNGQGRCCSRFCAAIARISGPTENTCLICHVRFSIRPSQYRIGKDRYCSRSCANSARAIPSDIRFWRLVQKSNDGHDCWLWKQPKADGNYPIFVIKAGRLSMPAHRFSWILTFGEIPDGLCVLHRCDVRHCVKPAHLFLGTHQDNSDDAVRKNRQAKGSRCARSKLTELQVAEIRSKLAAGASSSTLANLYKVTVGTIYHIQRRFTWKHIA